MHKIYKSSNLLKMNLLKIINEIEKVHNIKLRPQQYEIIKYVLYQWLGKNQNNIFIEAPTGIGKSYIAFFISEIMNKLNKNGYILTSDISLQNQYASDARHLKFYRPDVKGTDNYTCTENGLPYSQGKCQKLNFGIGKQSSLKCYENCPYIKARTKASEAKTSILNYNYYLTMLNGDSEKRIFDIRDFVIYDEAHKIIDIVQDMYAPVVNKELYDKIQSFEYELNKNKDIFEIDYNFSKPILDIITKLRLNTDKNDSYDNIIIFKELISNLISDVISDYKILIEDFLDRQDNRLFDIIYLNDYVKYIENVHMRFNDYINLIDSTELDTMFVNQQEYLTKYNFINEHYLIKKNLLDNSNLNLFMSATLGEEYPSMLGCVDYVYKSFDSDFDYEKSPIYIYENFNANWKNREVVFPKMLKELDDIITKNHKNVRGLIHTASYMNSEYITEYSKHNKRLIGYDDSKGKELAIENLKQGDNLILIGPSVVEGIDLKDDLSRFQIIFKIPYPSLADGFIKYKFEKNPKWYNWATRIKTQQALGRSIRHKEDYAVSYILDSSVKRMIKQFPVYIKKRIIFK